jgi:putative oxidoreductase
MKYVAFTGRIFYAVIFLMTALTHFSRAAIGYAIAKDVPMPSFFVPVSGIIAVVGAISIMLGYKAKGGALLIILFLIPVTYKMHDFWNETDPVQYKMQVGNFVKNLSLLGAAMLITYFGAGPFSIDHSANKRKNKPDKGLGK